MRYTTVTFAGRKGQASYKTLCGGCNRIATRKVTVEHTVNPFNKNEDGSVKTPMEVQRSAQAEAERQAKAKEGDIVTCKTCAEAPMRELLLAMAAEPARFFQVPHKGFYGSPMATLLDRKQVAETFEFKDGNPHNYAPGNYISQGYRITAAGLVRAAKFKPEPVAA